MKQLLIDCREMIADLCDDNDLPYPVELLHRLAVALGEMPCVCIDKPWCDNYDRCKQNETI
jgi:hypothetical protein